jgi:aryl-alcohol dehydrogenase-like predicted oxidoreductase
MVNKLILGTVQFGLNYGINNSNGQVSESEIKKILDFSNASGIEILDSADAYGTALEEIGNYHLTSNNKFKVINKFSSTEKSDISILEKVKNALHKTNLPNFEVYQFHKFEDAQNEQMLEAMSALKAQGLFKKIGVSVYTNEEVEKASLIKELDVIQLPYNLLDNSNQRKTSMAQAKASGKELHVRSVFLQGLFFKTTLPPKLLPLEPYLEQIKSICSRYNLNINHLALAYALNSVLIDKVLIGVDSLQQLQNNVKYAQTPIAQELIDLVDNIHVNQIHLLNPSNW